MERQATCAGKQRYEAVLDTAGFLAAGGHHELALEVTRRALEQLHLEKETAPEGSGEGNGTRELEAVLTRQYLAFRAKIDEGRADDRKPVVQTVLIAGIISFFIVVTTAVVVWQFQSLVRNPLDRLVGTLQTAVKTEVPKLSSQVQEQIPLVSRKVQEELPRATDKLTALIDRQLSRAIDQRIEALLQEKLPPLVEEKLQKLSLPPKASAPVPGRP